MASRRKSFQAIRGMKDILAKDWLYYDWILSNAKKIFGRYNFQRIETPILEKAELFTKGVGKKTDIVNFIILVLSFVMKNHRLAVIVSFIN